MTLTLYGTLINNSYGIYGAIHLLAPPGAARGGEPWEFLLSILVVLSQIAFISNTYVLFIQDIVRTMRGREDWLWCAVTR